MKSKPKEKGRRVEVEQKTGWFMKKRVEKGKLFHPVQWKVEEGWWGGWSELAELFPDLQVMLGGLAGPLGTAAVMASSLAPCRLTAGKVSWATEAPSAPCLYCDMLHRAIRAMDLLKPRVSAEKTSLVTRCDLLHGTGIELLLLARTSTGSDLLWKYKMLRCLLLL